VDEDERAGEPGGVPQDDQPRDDLAQEPADGWADEDRADGEVDGDTDADSWDGLTEDLPDAEDLELEEAADVPVGWWRPTWALVMALSFVTLQVLGVVVGLGTIVFDLIHDNPALDGVLARVGVYLVVVFSLTASAWAAYLARPRLRRFIVAATCMVAVPAAGYLVLRVING
jgi:hypothetical protein